MPDALAQYRQDLSRVPSDSVRKEALSRLLEHGFPKTNMERWRFTDISVLSKVYFPALSSPADLLAVKKIFDEVKCPAAHYICMLNGRLMTAWSDFKSIPGVEISNDMATVADGNSGENNAFVLWNRALATEELQLVLKPHSSERLPLQIIWITTGEAEGAGHSRLSIRALPGSETHILETFISSSRSKVVANHIANIVLESDARLWLYQTREGSSDALHFSHQFIVQEQNSDLRMVALTLGGKITRVDSRVHQKGEACNTSLHILNALHDHQHCDDQTTITHGGKQGLSDETVKNILHDTSRAVFNGRIIVRQNAPGTNASQTNKNILLSPSARVNAIPQLEIYTDDVACSHGTTTGELEDEALFYLRSRGISEEEARAILLIGFSKDILETIPVATVKAEFSTRLNNWLTRNDS